MRSRGRSEQDAAREREEAAVRRTTVGAVRSTGVGSLPGTSVRDAISLVTGEFPELVFLPELPARGPGADMIGRAASLLGQVSDDFAVATTPTGWRIADLQGVDMRRAGAYWREDLETFEEFCHMATGEVKVQLTGPITLAASLELVRGERVLSDEGAVRDLVAAHREAVSLHLADVRRRLPKASLIVQIDEPSMDAALQGTIRTQSGWGKIWPLDEAQVLAWHKELAATIVAGGGTPWMHSCAPHWPLELAHAAGYRGISGDVSLLQDRDEDALASAIEAGVVWVAGVIPTLDEQLVAAPRTEAKAAELIRHRYQRIGFPDSVLAKSLIVSTCCGLGHTSHKAARVAISRSREVARVLNDMLEGVDE